MAKGTDKRFRGFDSRLVLGPVIPKTLKMGVVSACKVSYDKVGTTKHNWSARCEYNSVYEQLFKTSDIMSVFKRICVGHSSTFYGYFGCHKP